MLFSSSSSTLFRHTTGEPEARLNVNMYTNLKGNIKVGNLTYSWTRRIRTRLFRIPRYFEHETTSLESLLQYFTTGYF